MYRHPGGQHSENIKLVLWGIHPENEALGLAKRRNIRDHAYLKGCHGKGEADLFVIAPERGVRIAGPKLQRSRLQSNRTEQSELCRYGDRVGSELPAPGGARGQVGWSCQRHHLGNSVFGGK